MPFSFKNNIIPKHVMLKEKTPVNRRSGVIATSSVGSFWWPPTGQSAADHMHLEQSVVDSHNSI